MREKISRIVLLVGILAFGLLWVLEPTYSSDPLKNQLLRDVVQRGFGGAIFVLLLFFLGYRVWHKPLVTTWAALIPCLLVVINNFPIIGLAIGDVTVVRGDMMGLFLLDCLLIGVFEEIAFRGTIFLALLERRRATKKQIFWTTALSSAIFGLIHLANLFAGANPGATLLQVGYSFLIGGMCAIVLLRSHNLIFCILLHTLFDIGGRMVGTVATGRIWNLPTVVLTAVLGVLVAAWMVWELLRVRPEDTDALYPNPQKSKQN